MRALLIAPTPFYIEKGSSLRVSDMIERLVERGYKVDVVCYPQGEDRHFDGVKLVRAGVKELVSTSPGPSLRDIVNDLFLLYRCVQLGRKYEYELIQCEDVEAAAIGVVMPKRKDTRMVYDLHNPASETLRINGHPLLARIAEALEGPLYRRFDELITNWKQWEELIRERYGIDAVSTIRDSLPDEARAVSLPADEYILYSGNFEEYQGVDILIEAFESVASKIDLVLVGDPSPEIRELVRSSPHANEIHLLGRRDIEETNYLIDHAACCVIPRRHGANPGTKLIHYGQRDTAVVATDLPCNAELDTFDVEIYWTAPDPESMSDALELVLDER